MLLTLLLAVAGWMPTAPQPACVTARVIGAPRHLGPTSSDLRQALIEIDASRCPGTQLVRITTGRGGRIPPLGYWRTGSGYPTKIRYWVMNGATVQHRAAPNVWRDVPIVGRPW